MNKEVHNMSLLGYVLENIFFALTRFIPFPTKTGLIKIGNPDRNSPVFVTGNYRLTVIRLKRALKNIDCYLLVANSRGINVWCSSAGGHFTNHSVISVVKTSGIEDLVDHRKLVLPQLAATGLDRKALDKKIGWKIIWGPVYAKNIPQFVQEEFKKSPQMSLVHFSFKERVEMSTAWAFPTSIVLVLIGVLFFHSTDILMLLEVIWGLSFGIFLMFPIYEPFMRKNYESGQFKYYDLRLGLIQVIAWVLTLVIVAAQSYILTKTIPQSYMINWALISLLIIIVLTFDLLGNSPTYKSSMSEERFLKITLDTEKCKGAAYCEVVCPKGCFEVDHVNHKARIVDADLCVKCGACVAQCPFDALYYKTADGNVVLPDTIRQFKINLMGKRMIKIKET